MKGPGTEAENIYGTSLYVFLHRGHCKTWAEKNRSLKCVFALHSPLQKENKPNNKID